MAKKVKKAGRAYKKDSPAAPAPAPGSIGYQVRAWREDRDLSQDALADRMPAYSGKMISAIERGRHNPGVPALMEIAKALGITFSMLVDLDPAKHQERPWWLRYSSAPPERRAQVDKVVASLLDEEPVQRPNR